jgi:hypothetical protein
LLKKLPFRKLFYLNKPQKMRFKTKNKKNPLKILKFRKDIYYYCLRWHPVYTTLVQYLELPMLLLIENILCGTQHLQINRNSQSTWSKLNATKHNESVLWSNWKIKKEAVTTLAIEQVESAIFLQDLAQKQKICFWSWMKSSCLSRSSCIMWWMYRNSTIRD